MNINEIFKAFEKHNPNPKAELDYVNHFTFLVAIILSARTTDVQVNKATKELFKKYNTPEAILKLGEEGLKKYVKTIGLYNTKAKNIIRLCEILIDEYDSKVPTAFDNLVKLPGVGRKSANVFLNSAFEQPVMPVDTHVFRVANRIGLVDTNNINKVEQDLLKVIPNKWMKNAPQWLVLHGRYVCKALKPQCNNCIINKYCKYESKK